MKKISQIVEREIVDTYTGEVVSTMTTKTYTATKEPPYLKVYMQDIVALRNMPSSQADVLWAIAAWLPGAGCENPMVVALPKHIKELICEKLGWKNMHTLEKAITKLVQREILIREGSSVYRFNPYLFGKGAWKDIQALRLTIDYDPQKGRRISSMRQYSDNTIDNVVPFPAAERETKE